MSIELASQVYQELLNSPKCNETFKSEAIDLAWLNQQLTLEEISELNEKISAYISVRNKTMFEKGFYYAQGLFSTNKDKPAATKGLSLLFDTYKSSTYYEQIELDIDFNWLIGKLNTEDIEEIERQSVSLLLENERGVFIGCLKFILELMKELIG